MHFSFIYSVPSHSSSRLKTFKSKSCKIRFASIWISKLKKDRQGQMNISPGVRSLCIFFILILFSTYPVSSFKDTLHTNFLANSSLVILLLVHVCHTVQLITETRQADRVLITNYLKIHFKTGSLTTLLYANTTLVLVPLFELLQEILLPWKIHSKK